MRQQKKNHKNLAQKLSEQILLDESLRNAKNWFESVEDPHKWGILSDCLAKDGTQVKYRELLEIFSSV